MNRLIKSFAAVIAGALLCGAKMHAYELSECSKTFDAAGVLPFTMRQGEVWVLLGHEPKRRYWTDFVGGRKDSDCGPEETALRELEEKSRAAYPVEEMLLKIQNSKAVILSKGRVHIWLIEVSWIADTEIAGYPELAESEKDTYCWVNINALLSAVDNGDKLTTEVPQSCPGKRRFLWATFRDNLVRGSDFRKHVELLTK